MGCWGITAFESDTGLDAIGLIRNHLPEQGDVKLQQMIDWLRADSWNAPPEVSEGVSHTSPMAVAELIVKFQEKDFSALDGIRGDKKFSSLSSFTASKGFFRNYPFLCFPTYLSFASNKRFLQRPYIVRFIIFNRLFVPSTKPLL